MLNSSQERTARPDSYDSWRHAALASDRESGTARWKALETSNAYDYRAIRRRLDELRALRASGDAKQLLHYYDEGMHGNMGGMGSPALYRRTKVGTKHLIDEYIEELALGLDQLAATDEIPTTSLLAFFVRAQRAYGTCGLMLSGAGSLGPFHLGVIKALWEQGLLPDVLSGASAGAMVAAFVCTHSDAALSTTLSHDGLRHKFEQLDQTAPQTLRGSRMNADYLRTLIETWIPDLTFGEAFELTGRSLNIAVAPSEVHQQSRGLNPITSPNVLIREAAMASAAVPGVFAPVRLAARATDGRRVAYVRSRTWVDGSITNDLPVHRLARLYGCNFFITSQTNPLVLWALQDPHSTSPMQRIANSYQTAAKEWVKASYPFALRWVRDIYPLNLWTRMSYSVLTQDYTADVNIMPEQRFSNPLQLLARLSPAQSMELVHDGERATWPRIERIRNSTRVGRKLTEIVQRLEPAHEPVFPPPEVSTAAGAP